MTSRMFFREIRHRFVAFSIGVVSVAAAVAVAVGTVLLLDSFDKTTVAKMDDFDRRTEKLMGHYRRKTEEAWTEYNDFVRREMLNLGFNLLLLDEKQKLSTPDAEMHYLPENYATKLREAGLITINHLVPFLQKKYRWKEGGRWVTLVGTMGDIYIKNPTQQTPMFQRVKPGTATLGWEIWKGAGLTEGDEIEIGGKTFTVARCRPSHTYTADESIWIPLDDAQEILGLEGKITGIKCINCECHTMTLGQLASQLREVLPGISVKEYKSKKLVRANSRRQAALEAKAALERQEQMRDNQRGEWLRSRGDLRAERAAFSSVLVPLVAVIAAAWLGLLTWDNVRRRRGEIGILRAFGVGGGKIIYLILSRAFVAGTLGSVIGIAGGWLFGIVRASVVDVPAPEPNPVLLVVCLAAAPLISIVAGWPSAYLATLMDPADVLREGEG